MGNAELKNAFKNSLKEAQQEKLGLSIDVLFDDSLVRHVK